MPRQTEFRYIRCKIERGGFSSERTFEIELANGNKVAGTANVQYFRDGACGPLDEDTPGYSQSIEGYVMCRIVREGDGAVVIDVPSMDAVLVPQEAITECSVE